jgi:hypothetical protein
MNHSCRSCTLARGLSAAALAGLASIAAAGSDPTAPPPGMGASADGTPHAAMYAASGARSASAPVAQAPRLESLRYGGAQPATALVDGHMLRVGDRLGDAVVMAIDDQGLSLRSGKGAQRLLALAPGIHKTPSRGSEGDGSQRASLAVVSRHKDSQ